MKYEDKKALALTLQYIDDLVEQRLERRLQQLEELVESSELVLSTENGLVLHEGREGPRGPRGFRGPEGHTGPAGRDSDPSDIARLLRVDESFISKVTGPAGRDGIDGKDGVDGEDGKDADVNQIIENLLSDKIFIESVKGPRGFAGKDADPREVAKAIVESQSIFEHLRESFVQRGEDGQDGVGLSSIRVTEEGEVLYTNTIGEVFSAGVLNQTQSPTIDSEHILNEIAKLKKEIDRTRSELTAQITRSVMSFGGSSSGGGEVRIEFMDDFNRTVAPKLRSTGNVIWNHQTGKFEIDSPLAGPDGIQTLITSANPYLIGNGNSAFIDRNLPVNMTDIYSIYVIEPTTREVVEVSKYQPDSHIQIDSNASLFDYIFQINYVEAPSSQGPWPLKIDANSVISPDGLRLEIPFVDFNIDSVESFRLLSNSFEVDGVVYLSDRIIVDSSTPMFGMKVELMITELPGQGTTKIVEQMSGFSHTIDFASNNINKVLNHMVINNATNQLVDTVVFLTETEIRFESSFDMTNLTVTVWYDHI